MMKIETNIEKPYNPWIIALLLLLAAIASANGQGGKSYLGQQLPYITSVEGSGKSLYFFSSVGIDTVTLDSLIQGVGQFLIPSELIPFGSGSDSMTTDTNFYRLTNGFMTYIPQNLSIGTGKVAENRQAALHFLSDSTLIEGEAPFYEAQPSAYVLKDAGAAGQWLFYNEDGVMRFENNASQDIYFSTGASEALRIKGATGRIGLGTDSPDWPLHLFAPSNITSALKLESTNRGATNQAILFSDHDTVVWTMGTLTDNSGDFIWYYDSLGLGGTMLRLTKLGHLHAGRLYLDQTPASGSASDSVLVWDPVSKEVQMRDGSTIGGVGGYWTEVAAGIHYQTSQGSVVAIDTFGSMSVGSVGVGNADLVVDGFYDPEVLINDPSGDGTLVLNGYSMGGSADILLASGGNAKAQISYASGSGGLRFFYDAGNSGYTDISGTEKMNIGSSYTTITHDLAVGSNAIGIPQATLEVDGDLLLANNNYLWFHNAASSNEIPVVQVNSSDEIYFGDLAALNLKVHIWGGNLFTTFSGQAMTLAAGSDTIYLNPATASLGVGTSTPDRNLEVTGNAIFSSGQGASNANVAIGLNRSADGNAILDLVAESGEASYDARFLRYAGANGNMEFWQSGTGDVRFYTGSTSSDWIFQQSTDTLLKISKHPAQSITDLNFNDGGRIIAGSTYDAFQNPTIQLWNTSSPLPGHIYFDYPGNVYFRHNGSTTDLFIEDGTGYVGIGTTTPSHKLHSYVTAGSNYHIIQSGANDWLGLFQSSTTEAAIYWPTDGVLRFGEGVNNISLNDEVFRLYQDGNGYGTAILWNDDVTSYSVTYQEPTRHRIIHLSNSTDSSLIDITPRTANHNGSGAAAVRLFRETDAATAQLEIYTGENNAERTYLYTDTIGVNTYMMAGADNGKEAVITPYKIHLFKDVTQNVGGATGTITYISWDDDAADSRVDPGYTFEDVTNPSRIEVDAAGRYRVYFVVNATNSGANRISIASSLRINGTTAYTRGRQYNYSRGTGFNAEFGVVYDSEIELNAGDYIEAAIWVSHADATYTVNTINAECEIIINRIE